MLSAYDSGCFRAEHDFDFRSPKASPGTLLARGALNSHRSLAKDSNRGMNSNGNSSNNEKEIAGIIQTGKVIQIVDEFPVLSRMKSDTILQSGAEIGQNKTKGKEILVEKNSGQGSEHGDLHHPKFRNKISYLDVVSGNSNFVHDSSLNFIPNLDKHVYNFSYSEIAKETVEWQAVLLGGIIGANISIDSFKKFASLNWKVNCPDFSLMRNGIWIIKFLNAEDRSWVVENGPWLIEGMKPIALNEWEPGMKMDWSSFDSVPVWTILSDLDPIFLSQHMLNVIGSMIGSPICMDKFTTQRKRLSFARILVNVNVEEAKCREILLVGPDGKQFRQSVQFEWYPWVCDSCKIFGHSTAYCKRKSKLKQNQKVSDQKVWKIKEKSVPGIPPIENAIDAAVNKNDAQVDGTALTVSKDAVADKSDKVLRIRNQDENFIPPDEAIEHVVVEKGAHVGGIALTVSKDSVSKDTIDDKSDEMPRIESQDAKLILRAEAIEHVVVDKRKSSSSNTENKDKLQDKGWKEAKG